MCVREGGGREKEFDLGKFLGAMSISFNPPFLVMVYNQCFEHLPVFFG